MGMRLDPDTERKALETADKVGRTVGDSLSAVPSFDCSEKDFQSMVPSACLKTFRLR